MKSKHVSLDIKGYIEVKCIVSAKNVTKTYTGFAQTKKSESLNDLINRAVKDCVYQHFRLLGLGSNNFIDYKVLENDYKTKLLNYKMHYVNLVKVKRVAKKLRGKRVKRNGKYYTQSVDNENNVISEEKYKPNSVNKINKKKTKTYLIETRDKRTNEVIKLEKPNYIRKL